MLRPDYLSSCADDIVKLYNDLNDAIIRDIVRRLVNLDFDVSQTAVWQMEKLQEVGGMVYNDALSEISKITGKTEKELKKLFEDAGTESLSFDNNVYKKAGITPLPLSQSPAMLQILTAGYQKCKGELKNLTLTTANMSQSLFINAVNGAYMQAASGAFSQNAAIKNAIEAIGNSGTWVLYPSGHRDRADVAVRRAVQTGIGQTCGQMQIQQLDDMMWDVVDVTAHMGARPEHAQWQGGRFSYKGRNKKYPDFIETTGYGSVDGLLGAWCRHNFYPAIDGTPRMYTQEQIDEWNSHKVTYNGVEYSDREALDIQRAKERGLRATKRELVALDEAIKSTKDEALKKELSDDFGRISVKLAKQESSLNDFLDQTGFKKDYSRSQIKEFNRSMSGKIKAASKKELQKREQSGIIKKNAFFTKDDPMREVFGSAFDSNKGETESMLKSFKQKGVKVIFKEGVMVYQPNPTPGKPGQILIDKKASYSAFKHEERHVLDDEATGWLGFRNFMNKDTAIKFEVDAYDVEISLAKLHNMPEMVKRLEKLKEKRRRELLGE